MKEKVYPNQTLEKLVRMFGQQCSVLWEMKGPKDTDVAWIVAYSINGTVVLVQTYGSGGWEAYTPCGINDTDATFRDVLHRCNVKVPAYA
jgi:hypothetical protein